MGTNSLGLTEREMEEWERDRVMTEQEDRKKREQEARAELEKFRTITDALVAIVQGTKRLEVTKTHKQDGRGGFEERTIYRMIDN